MKKRNFPFWYSWVKWGGPICLATIMSLLVVGFMVGAIAIPSYLPIIRWLPAFYASLDTVQAAIAIAYTIGAVGSLMGLCTAMFIRGTLLFPLCERLATQNLENHFLLEDLEDRVVALEKHSTLIYSRTKTDSTPMPQKEDLQCKPPSPLR